MNILSSLTYPLVVWNLYDFLSSVENYNKGSYTDVDCQRFPSTAQQFYWLGRHFLSVGHQHYVTDLERQRQCLWIWHLLPDPPALPRHEDIWACNRCQSLEDCLHQSQSVWIWCIWCDPHHQAAAGEAPGEEPTSTHGLSWEGIRTSSGIPSTLTAPPKCRYGGTNSSTPTPPVFSYAPPACPNCSKSASAYTRDLSTPRFCLSFAWTWPRWIFRHLNPGHFNSQMQSSKLTKPIVGLNVKCKTGASGWTCMDCASTSRRLRTWSVGPRLMGWSELEGSHWTRSPNSDISLRSLGVTATPSAMPAPTRGGYGRSLWPSN